MEIQPTPDNAALWGRLDQVGLLEICQILLHRVGLIRIESQGLGGSVYLREGIINRVSWGNLPGRDAFLELALLVDGQFRFHPGIITEETNNTMHPDRMMLEAALYLDHWSVLWEHNIGPLTLLSRFGYKASQEARIFDHEAKIELWNGMKHPIAAGDLIMNLAERGIDRIELAKALNALWEEKIISIEQPAEYSNAEPVTVVPLRPKKGKFWDGFRSLVPGKISSALSSSSLREITAMARGQA
jgi:hypothetical protein